jgi:hypothetical protein
MKHMDIQIDGIKSLISDIKVSQEFICNEFDLIKIDIKNIVTENKILKKKCEVLEEAYQAHDDRLCSLEIHIDELHQQELNSNLIVAGLPDKLKDPKTMVLALLNALECEESISDVISCNYMTPHNNFKQNPALPNEVKIIIKFRDSMSKNKVSQQKKKIKPILTSADLGFHHNHNNQLYFRENLTSFRNLLYREARQIKKSKNFKYLWIRDGNILMREAEGSRVIKIGSKADLIRISGKQTITGS